MKNTKRFIARYSRETEKALKVSFDYKDGFYDIWLPKSQIIITEKDDCGNCVIEVPFWLLKNSEPCERYDSVPVANVLANFITRTGGDVYCNA